MCELCEQGIEVISDNEHEPDEWFESDFDDIGDEED